MRNSNVFFSLARFFIFYYQKIILTLLRRYFWHILAVVVLFVGITCLSYLAFGFILKLFSYLVIYSFYLLKYLFLNLYRICRYDPSAVILIASFSYTFVAIASFFRFVDPKIILHFTSAASSTALYCCCWHLAIRNGISLGLLQILFAGIVLGTILTQAWMRIAIENDQR